MLHADGRFDAGGGERVEDGAGSSRAIDARGFDHFVSVLFPPISGGGRERGLSVLQPAAHRRNIVPLQQLPDPRELRRLPAGSSALSASRPFRTARRAPKHRVGLPRGTERVAALLGARLNVFRQATALGWCATGAGPASKPASSSIGAITAGPRRSPRPEGGAASTAGAGGGCLQAATRTGTHAKRASRYGHQVRDERCAASHEGVVSLGGSPQRTNSPGRARFLASRATGGPLVPNRKLALSKGV